MVDEYDSNTAGGIDCQHFECRGGGGVGVAAVGEAKDGRLGFEKERVGKLLEVLTLAMLEVVFFWPVLCNGMLRIFPKNNCSKMSVKTSHLFF